MAHMKLHVAATANRRISNIEPRNDEGWNRRALSFRIIKSVESLPLTFVIRFFRVFISIRVDSPGQKRSLLYFGGHVFI